MTQKTEVARVRMDRSCPRRRIALADVREVDCHGT